jgi:hypothetical protein
MKIFDFLFYYFVQWFEVSDRRKVKTISYQDQAAYALAICSILYILLINSILEYILFNTFKSKIPNLIFIAIGLMLYFLYRYIYLKKERYKLINEMSDPKFNVSDRAGRIITLIVFFTSLLILLLTAIILHSIN